MNDRPSWTNRPEGWSWRDASWGDRARAGVVVLAILGLFLAGSVR